MTPLASPHPPRNEAEGNTLKKATVLLAEDDKEMRSLMTRAFHRRGFKVIEAADGIELLDHITAMLMAAYIQDPCGWQADVIVSDVRMPGLTGLEILNLLKEVECSTPTVLITAFGSSSIHHEAKRLGAAAVLDKPFELDDLVEIVSQVLLDNSGDPFLA